MKSCALYMIDEDKVDINDETSRCILSTADHQQLLTAKNKRNMFAKCYVAKRALAKALASASGALHCIKYEDSDVSVERDINGCPYLRFTQSLLNNLRRFGFQGALLSLSDENRTVFGLIVVDYEY